MRGSRQRFRSALPYNPRGLPDPETDLLASAGSGKLVPIMFSCHSHAMDDDLRPVPKHELRFDIEQALGNARSLWPRRHIHGQHNPLGPMANAVVEHLALCGIRFFRKPPTMRHATPAQPYATPSRGKDSETPET